MDCSWPGCSVHGIFQVRILGQVAISFSKGSSHTRGQPCVPYLSHTGKQVLTTASPEKPVRMCHTVRTLTRSGSVVPSQRPRRAGGVNSSPKLAGSRPRKSQGFSLNPMTVKQSGQAKHPVFRLRAARQEAIPCHLLKTSVLFFSGLRLIGEAHHIGEETLLYCLQIQMLAHRETSSQKSRIKFDKMSGHPGRLMRKIHIHLHREYGVFLIG